MLHREEPRERTREELINDLAQEQAKDDLTRVVKPYIIKATDLKAELRAKRHIKDYRKALARFIDDILVDEDIEAKRRHIAHILKISIKTVKRYIYDNGDGNNSSSVF